MERFYAELGSPSEDVGKAEALRRAQRAVRGLSAQEVLAHCERMLESLDEESDPALLFELRRDRAKAHVLAGDLAAAAVAFEELRDAADDAGVRRELEDTLARIRLKALAAPPVDYSRRPFEHLYYWAPFLLYGDWR